MNHECTLPDSLALPSVGYTRQRPVCTRQTLCQCYTRQTPLGKASHGKGIFAECQISGTRETFQTLPSARVLALGKAATCCPVEGHFAECIGLSTRQSGLFFLFCFFFLCFSIQIQQIYINAGVITCSYNDKYIIVNCDNSIDTNNTR